MVLDRLYLDVFVSNEYNQVTFDGTSRGQLSMVIYEWKDMQYLGKVTSYVDDMLPVSADAIEYNTGHVTCVIIAEDLRLHIRCR